MEWNEKNNVAEVASETNRLVIGKRVAAEMMVLCLSVMSLGGEPLQMYGMKNPELKFTETVRTTENLKTFDSEAMNEMHPETAISAGNEKTVAKEGIRKIAKETARIENLTEPGNHVSLTEAADEETLYLEKTVAEIPSAVWNPVKEVPNTVDEDTVKAISADRLNGSESKTERETPVLPADRTEFTINEDTGKDGSILDDKVDTITPVTPAEVPVIDDSGKKDSVADSPIDENKNRIEEMKPEDNTDTVDENADGMNSGFLMDESGKITGISDRDLVAVDGCLTLPSEGCTGIAAGAFLGAGDGIVEVYLPANMTDLEEGAFLGLNEAEWIETAEENPVYSSEDGVLFSENGTCLFAFPAGRTGTYPLPESVTRIATDAFAGASIEKISDLRDREIDFGNIPENIVLERF